MPAAPDISPAFVHPSVHPVLRTGFTHAPTSAAPPAQHVPPLSTVRVGSGPESLAYDPVLGDVFAINSGSSNISVVSDATSSVVATIALPAGSVPVGIAYDPSLAEVFVSSYSGHATGNVTAIAAGNASVVATMNLSHSPGGLAVDTGTGQLFLSMPNIGSVWVLSAANLSTIVRINHTGQQPQAITYDSSTGTVYVADEAVSSTTVYAINDTTDTVVAGFSLAWTPTSVFADSSAKQIFVGEGSVNQVVAFDNLRNYRATIGVPGWSNGFALDSARHELFAVVANGGFSSLVTIDDRSDQTLATWWLPGPPGGAVFDPGVAELFVSLYNQNELLTFAPPYAENVTFTEHGLPLRMPWSVAFDYHNESSNGTSISFRVANGTYPYTIGRNTWFRASPSHGNVTVSSSDVNVSVSFAPVALAPVLFREAGLPPGARWSVAIGYPSETTSTSNRSFNASIPYGLLPLNITAPAMFGVAQIRGPNHPEQDQLNISGRSTETVNFGPLEQVTFESVGLPYGYYDMSIQSILAHGGPPAIGDLPGEVGFACPGSVVYASSSREVFVADSCDAQVDVFAGRSGSLVASLPVSDADQLAYDPTLGEVFVTNGTTNLTVLGESPARVVKVVDLGSYAHDGFASEAYDPATHELFTAGYGGTILALSDASLTPVANGSVPFESDYLTVAPAQGELFAAQCFGNGCPFGVLSVLNVSTLHVVATVALDGDPQGIVFDPVDRTVFVSTGANVTDVVSVTNDTVVARLPVESSYSGGAAAYDPNRDDVLVSGYDNVTVIQGSTDRVLRVLFVGRALGGLSVDTAVDAVYVASDNFTGRDLSGYSASHLEVVSLRTSSSVAFVPVGGTEYTVTLVRGSYIYQVSGTLPGYFGPTNASSYGILTVGSHNMTKLLHFVTFGRRAILREHGLPAGTLWGAYVNGSWNGTWQTTTGSISVLLPNGSYNFSYWAATGLPSPVNASFVASWPTPPEAFSVRFT